MKQLEKQHQFSSNNHKSWCFRGSGMTHRVQSSFSAPTISAYDHYQMRFQVAQAGQTSTNYIFIILFSDRIFTVATKSYQQPLIVPDFCLKHVPNSIKTWTKEAATAWLAQIVRRARLRWSALEGPERRSEPTAKAQWDLGSAVVQGPGRVRESKTVAPVFTIHMLRIA